MPIKTVEAFNSVAYRKVRFIIDTQSIWICMVYSQDTGLHTNGVCEYRSVEWVSCALNQSKLDPHTIPAGKNAPNTSSRNLISSKFARNRWLGHRKRRKKSRVIVYYGPQSPRECNKWRILSQSTALRSQIRIFRLLAHCLLALPVPAVNNFDYYSAIL